jgi:hypothetical protein
MSLKKYIDFKCRQTAAFIMFFLNFFFAAAPFITAFANSNNGAYLSQQHNNHSGAEDTNHLSDATEGRIGYSFSSNKKQQVSRFFNKGGQYAVSSAAADDSVLAHPLVSSSFVVRPAYYTLLFLYHLF